MKTKCIVAVVAIALLGTAACTPTTQPLHRSGGGDGGGQHHAATTASFVDEWSGSDLVDDDGNVAVAANEVEVAPTHSSGGAPPALGTPDENN